MGKSLKNGVSPDDITDAYGADTLRMYEMAMGPLDGDRPWRPADITGMHRFLQRLWRLIVDESTGETLVVSGAALDDATARLLHRTIAVVREDFAATALPHRDRADHRADRARVPAAATCRAPWPSRWC